MLPSLQLEAGGCEQPALMFLSRNTIKSQAYLLYRKLGASTRSQAVTRSRELGLLEG
jgi:LuxR family transcriptional regulator, maltose regulon positive regulatory protein